VHSDRCWPTHELTVPGPTSASREGAIVIARYSGEPSRTLQRTLQPFKVTDVTAPQSALENEFWPCKKWAST
jgi:hypothetical protein